MLSPDTQQTKVCSHAARACHDSGEAVEGVGNFFSQQLETADQELVQQSRLEMEADKACWHAWLRLPHSRCVCVCVCACACACVCVCVAQFYLVAYEHPQAEATILGIEADDVGARHAITRKGSINNN